MARTMEEIKTVIELLNTIVDVVKASGEHGAPGGVLYASLMSAMSLDQFELSMSVLVQAGKVKKVGHVYFATEVS